MRAAGRWQSAGRRVAEAVHHSRGEATDSMALCSVDNESMASIVTAAMKRRGVNKLVNILQKPPSKRTEDDINFCVRFLHKHQFELRFFRNKLRSQIDKLCRVMGAIVCSAKHKLYTRGDRATHLYVVMEGRIGVFIPEQEQVEDVAPHLRKARMVALASRLRPAQTELADALEFATAVAKKEKEAERAKEAGTSKGHRGQNKGAAHEVDAAAARRSRRSKNARIMQKGTAVDEVDSEGSHGSDGEDGGDGSSSDSGSDGSDLRAGVGAGSGGVAAARALMARTTLLHSDGSASEDSGDDEVDAVEAGETLAERPAAASDTQAVEKRDPRKLWHRAFRRIVLALRMGATLMDLARAAHVMGGTKWVQSRLVRRGNAFGELSLFHPSRLRDSAAYSRVPSILLTIPREAYVDIRKSEEQTGDLSQDVAFLSTLHWLHAAPTEVTVDFAYRAQKRVFPRGAVVMEPGDRSELMVIIKEGSVRVEAVLTAAEAENAAKSRHRRRHARGSRRALSVLPPVTRRTVQLGLLGSGEWFGERPLLSGEPNDFRYVTESRCVLMVLSAKTFGPHRKLFQDMLIDHLVSTVRHRSSRLKQLASTALNPSLAMLRGSPASGNIPSSAGVYGGPPSAASPAASPAAAVPSATSSGSSQVLPTSEPGGAYGSPGGVGGFPSAAGAGGGMNATASGYGLTHNQSATFTETGSLMMFASTASRGSSSPSRTSVAGVLPGNKFSPVKAAAMKALTATADPVYRYNHTNAGIRLHLSSSPLAKFSRVSRESEPGSLAIRSPIVKQKSGNSLVLSPPSADGIGAGSPSHVVLSMPQLPRRNFTQSHHPPAVQSSILRPSDPKVAASPLAAELTTSANKPQLPSEHSIDARVEDEAGEGGVGDGDGAETEPVVVGERSAAMTTSDAGVSSVPEGGGGSTSAAESFRMDMSLLRPSFSVHSQSTAWRSPDEGNRHDSGHGRPRSVLDGGVSPAAVRTPSGSRSVGHASFRDSMFRSPTAVTSRGLVVLAHRTPQPAAAGYLGTGRGPARRGPHVADSTRARGVDTARGNNGTAVRGALHRTEEALSGRGGALPGIDVGGESSALEDPLGSMFESSMLSSPSFGGAGAGAGAGAVASRSMRNAKNPHNPKSSVFSPPSMKSSRRSAGSALTSSASSPSMVWKGGGGSDIRSLYKLRG